MNVRGSGSGLPPLTLRAHLRFDIISRIVDELRPASVLEIGCGQGAVGARLARRAKYVGAEPDAESCAVARERIEPYGGAVVLGTDGDVAAGESFELVCAFEVLEHISDDIAALRAWATRVKPNRHLLLSVPADQERFGPMDERVGHYRRYDEAMLSSRIEAAGLVMVSMTRYGWPLTYVLEGVRNRLDTHRGAVSQHTPEQLSASSGRTFQPSAALTGRALELSALPFRYLQRRHPTAGTGLILLAAKV